MSWYSYGVAEDFHKSFQVTSEGVEAAMLEKFSIGGASGSFFYFTFDYKYIVKTVSNYERRLLESMVESFYQQCEMTSGSLLTRFCGLYSVRLAPEQQVSISSFALGRGYSLTGE